ncbi:MAG TPA: M20/M25/M40 family metallo-hydrolase, partial [Allosphingosinicella sp.]
MQRNAIALAAILGLLLGAMTFKGILIDLPEVRKSRELSAFDTQRALVRLGRILGDERPHPVDSAANDAVRNRLIGELRAIGLTPVVTDRVACSGSSGSRTVSCARVRNVTASLGPARGERLLLASHYDSTPVGPGAADDGIGVAVMLETAALLAREQPKRPVTFLFDEGEETGLLGARAFLDGDLLANDVTALLNFEARGVTGPAMMYETSHPNGAAIAHFTRAAIRPFANSLATDFARMIPNTTDVELFKARGWTILNFAIIGNETRYHSGGDTLAALDPRSVQHMGDQALALARDFPANEAETGSGPVAYADWLGRGFVVIPLAAVLVGVALLLAGAAVLAWRRREGLAPAAGAIVAT